MQMVLRDYQEEAISEIQKAYREGYEAVFYVLPTGGGKSPIFTTIAYKMQLKNKKNLTLAHRKELVNQARRHLRKMGVNSGVIMGGKSMALTWNVQVGSAASVVRRLDEIPRPDLITEDEGHHGTNNTHLTIFNRWQDEGTRGEPNYVPAPRILRVSATPWDMAGKGVGLKNKKEKLIIGPSMKTLIKRGFVVKPMVFCPPLAEGLNEELDKVSVDTKGDLNKEQQEAIMDKPTITGNAVEHYKKLCNGKPAIAFCTTVKHAQHVAEQFVASGIRAEMIDGAACDAERDRMIQGLASGLIQVLTSCDLIGEGVDIPAVYAAIMLRRTKSLVIFLQQAGRPDRPVYAPGFDLNTEAGRLASIAASDKPYFVLLDHVGNCGKMVDDSWVPLHGFPDQDREWDLGPRKKKTKKQLAEEPVPAMRTCPQCWCTHMTAPECPQCGWHYLTKQRKPIKEVDGQLIQVSEAEILAEEKMEMKKELKAARNLEDLLRIEKERGYKPGWAEKQHEFRRQAAARHTQKYYESMGP